MVVFDPRRTETAKVATEHHFVRPGSDALVLLAMLQVLFADGLATAPSYADGLAAVRAPSPSSPPSGPRPTAGCRPTRSAGWRASSPPLTAPSPTAGSASRPTSSARCASGRSTCSTCSPATSTRGGAMFTAPAIDAVGTGLIGRGHHDLWRSRVRGLPEFGGELPVAALREEIETPGKGQIRAMLTLSGNPVSPPPTARG